MPPRCSHAAGNGAAGEASAAPSSAATTEATSPATPNRPDADRGSHADLRPESTEHGERHDPSQLLACVVGSHQRRQPRQVAEGFGSELSSDTKPPLVFTFELPGTTRIDSFSAALRGEAGGAPAANVSFAVSTSGPIPASKRSTITRNPNGPTATLTANVDARWVRVTANQAFDSVTALGTLASPPAHLDPTGVYIVQPVPDVNGSFASSGTQADLDQARFVSVGAGLTGTTCRADAPIAPYVGQLAGRTWDAKFAGNKDANGDTIHAVVNDDASIIAGVLSGHQPLVFMRTTKPLAGCVTRSNGTGAHHVLVLDQDPIPTFYPTDANPPISGFSFDAIGAGMIDAATVAKYDTIVARGVCKFPDLAGPQQIALLLQWAAARGHKLVLPGPAARTEPTLLAAVPVYHRRPGTRIDKLEPHSSRERCVGHQRPQRRGALHRYQSLRLQPERAERDAADNDNRHALVRSLFRGKDDESQRIGSGLDATDVSGFLAL